MKKSQIQIGETIAILFIFFLLIVLVFGFYSSIQKSSFGRKNIEVNELRSVEITQRISFLPEIQCSKDNIIIDNCFDLLKLEALMGIFEKNISLRDDLYYDKLGYSSITIKKIYPEENTWILYENPLANSSNIFTPVPISLYDAKTKKYFFAILNITYYYSSLKI